MGRQTDCQGAEEAISQSAPVWHWLFIGCKHLDKCMYGMSISSVHARRNRSDRSQYIGEEGSDCALKAAVVLSNPWNLEVGSLALQRTFMGLQVYSRAMGTSMKALFES